MKKVFLIFLGIILLGFLAPVFAQSAGLVPCGGEGEDACTFCHFFVMLDRIIDFLIAPPTGIVFIIATLMLVIGGVLFVISAGEPAKIATATKTMTAAVLGLVIIFAAWLFINLFYTVIGVKGDWKAWNKIECSIDRPTVAQIENYEILFC